MEKAAGQAYTCCKVTSPPPPPTVSSLEAVTPCPAPVNAGNSLVGIDSLRGRVKKKVCGGGGSSDLERVRGREKEKSGNKRMRGGREGIKGGCRSN